MNGPSPREVIDLLGLTPHPEEGGWFRETHRVAETVPHGVLPGRYSGPRSMGSAIYYLLTRDTYSHMHCLQSDEIFHFYAGGPCEMLQLHPDGAGERLVLGNDLLGGQRPQILVPRGSWQGLRLLPDADFALMGCTVAPGFEYADYAHGDRAQLIARYPEFHDEITRLTIS
ncbi:cupin domain-containing protein [Desulfovibrio sp. Huiquan2017]|uniref:cupin domain-containing protein n=1 Tax=Desulfovibrio sp. Huiquan2017 TaxID=2816861 RepID=UPI001A91AD6A|nr:cupin domain-containing protein [Desulfovibrio sp. Huiquan2017]